MLLAGCASQPRINPACEVATANGSYLVTVEHRQSITHILLHDTDTGTLALNPVGARLFEVTGTDQA